MSYNVRPGDIAVIINSANGPNGASVGRRVRVHADAPVANPEFDAQYSDQFNALNDPKHYCPPSPYEKEHTTLGKIWPVSCINGGTFMSEHGATGRAYIDVPDRWLRKEVTPPESTADQVKKELPTSVA